MPGRIITFYSYKGGTGRSMALANVAWALASHNSRVLVVDWDLEAPGLHRYFRPFLVDRDLTAPESSGLIDYVNDFADGLATPAESEARPKDWFRPYANVERWGLPLRTPGGQPLMLSERGEIRLVPAGRQDADYSGRVTAFPWADFYARQSGGVFFEAVRESMRQYDYTLIDSRTGVSDTAGVCTLQMPDILVICYTYNIQSIEGASQVARKVRKQRPELPIFPVAMRVEYQQEESLRMMREFARKRFHEFVPAGQTDEYFDKIEVPYLSQYAYWERLAAFDDRPRAKDSINAEMALLAQHVSGLDIDIVPASSALREEVADPRKLLLADSEPSAPATSYRRPVAKILRRAAISAVTAAAALLIAWQLSRVPTPAIQRTKILVENVTGNAPYLLAGSNTALGLFLEPDGLRDTPEARALYSSLVQGGIPVVDYVANSFSTTVRLTPDGESMVTCDLDVRFWRFSATKPTPPIGLGGNPAVDCLPLANRVLVLRGNAIDEYAAQPDGPPTRQVSRTLPAGQYFQMLASPDGRQLILLSSVGSGFQAEYALVLISLDNPKVEPERYQFTATNILDPIRVFATESAFVLVTTNAKRDLQLRAFPYRSAGFTPTSTDLPDSSALITAFTMSRSGRKVALSDGATLEIRDTGSGRVEQTAKLTDLGFFRGLEFDPTEKFLGVLGSSKLELRNAARIEQIEATMAMPGGGFGTPPAILLLGPGANIVVTAIGSEVMAFRRDVQPPADTLPWSDILTGLRSYTTVCLGQYARTSLFRESDETAKSNAEACEISQGRPPLTPTATTAPAAPAPTFPPAQAPSSPPVQPRAQPPAQQTATPRGPV